MTARLASLVALLAVGSLAAGCGGTSAKQRSPAPGGNKLRRDVRAATAANPRDFPATRGRSLQQLSSTLYGTGPQLGLAGSVFLPGRNRLAFGLIDPKGGFVYRPTAVYVASAPDAPARGPYVAPADSLVTSPQYRSQTAAGERDTFAAIYSAQVPFARPGRYVILTVSRYRDSQLVGAAGSVRVIPRSRDTVPEVGQRAPRVATDTFASANGNKAAVDTRRPFDDMHDTNLAEVAGKKPVALLFATPQLCQSRVCGPVTDIAEELKAKYGDRVAFIHQEVYRDNNPRKGLRAPLERFGLRSEPWLFVLDRSGRVAARLEGSFGFRDFEAALRRGLRGAPS